MWPSAPVLYKFSIAAVLFVAGFTAQAQEIRIRVVNISNGHPIPKQSVSVSLLYSNDEKTPEKYEAQLRFLTNANGEAQLLLPEPAPVHLAVQVRLISEHWHCRCMALLTTHDLIQKGIVQESRPEARGSATSANAEPRIILFLARPFTFLERLLYPLLKE